MQTSALSFGRDIRPLFRAVDIEHMSRVGVLLDDYTYMADPTNAQAVLEYLNGTRGPECRPAARTGAISSSSSLPNGWSRGTNPNAIAKAYHGAA